MPEGAPSVVVPGQPVPFQHPVSRLRERLAGAGAIKIAAIGSSSTAGTDSIVPYPQRLEAALRARIKGRNFDVLNRGVSGEEARDELGRMQRDVIDERPTVVIWQVGTNAAWKKELDLDDTGKAIREGLVMLAQASVDIILMDLQYVPALLVPDKIERAHKMNRLIDEAATGATVPVNVYKRFDLMQQWYEAEKVSFDRMVDPGDPNRLHHSDWSVTRMAEALADVMVKAASASQPA
jgi:lysophospholipase L1-like esterase